MQHEQFLDVLRFFLRMPLNATPVLEHFAGMPNARFYDFGGSERFVYVPATRENAVLLVAHADICEGGETEIPTELSEDGDIIRNADPEGILGADDRAGCAIVSILAEKLLLGHGVLITDGEEKVGDGATALLSRCGAVAAELRARYQFMIEFDQYKGRWYTCYDAGADEFREYVSKKIGEYSKAEFRHGGFESFTDICVLATDICGVNLSVGFYDEHTYDEYMNKSDWLDTLDVAVKWLSESDFPKFHASPAYRAFMRGVQYFEDKDKEAAVVEFTEAIRLKPDYALAYNSRGEVYHRLARDEDALRDHCEAVRFDPENYYYLLDRGCAYRTNRQYDLALRDYDEAQRIKPEKLEHINMIRRFCFSSRGEECLLIEKDYDKAIENYTEALRLEPGYVCGYTWRGEAYHRKGDYENAVRDFTEAINRGGLDSYYHGWRGDSYRAWGQLDKAKEDFETVLRLDPENKKAREALREMAERE